MIQKSLHIVSFENPFPPVYGGVIDVYFKIRALHRLGYKIYLHCFVLGEHTVLPELAQITEQVYFYKKNRNLLFFLSPFPFAVRSRGDLKLVQRLNSVQAPILFEGLQTSMQMDHKLLVAKKYLRLHNLEQAYYAGMYKSESNWVKKLLYFVESVKYASYQKRIANFDGIFTLSLFEQEYVRDLNKNAFYVPVFHGNEAVADLSGFGKYALYHGDLRLPDNKKAVAFLIKIFKKINYKLVIASSNGKEFVEQLIGDAVTISFVSLVDYVHLQRLLQDAHINVMLSFQQSGTKLKLVNSLFNSRFCLINNNMVDDPRILALCERANSEQEFADRIMELKNTSYGDVNRAEVLNQVLNDIRNAEVMDLVL